MSPEELSDNLDPSPEEHAQNIAFILGLLNKSNNLPLAEEDTMVDTVTESLVHRFMLRTETRSTPDEGPETKPDNVVDSESQAAEEFVDQNLPGLLQRYIKSRSQDEGQRGPAREPYQRPSVYKRSIGRE